MSLCLRESECSGKCLPLHCYRYLSISDNTGIRYLPYLLARYGDSFIISVGSPIARRLLVKELSRPISSEKHKETKYIIVRPRIVLAKPLCCFHDWCWKSLIAIYIVASAIQEDRGAGRGQLHSRSGLWPEAWRVDNSKFRENNIILIFCYSPSSLSLGCAADNTWSSHCEHSARYPRRRKPLCVKRSAYFVWITCCIF